MGHFSQVRHHGIANNVFAKTQGEHRLGLVVDLRAQDFTQLNRLPPGVGQLQRHDVFAGYGFNDSNGDQTQ